MADLEEEIWQWPLDFIGRPTLPSNAPFFELSDDHPDPNTMYLVLIADLDTPILYFHYMSTFSPQTGQHVLLPYQPAAPSPDERHRYVTQLWTRSILVSEAVPRAFQFLSSAPSTKLAPAVESLRIGPKNISFSAFQDQLADMGWMLRAEHTVTWPPPEAKLLSSPLYSPSSIGNTPSVSEPPSPSSISSSSLEGEEASFLSPPRATRPVPKRQKRRQQYPPSHHTNVTTSSGRLKLLTNDQLTNPEGRREYPGELTDVEQRTCRCVAHVGAQRANPYGICISRLKTPYPAERCGIRMNYEQLTPDEQRGWMYSHANKTDISEEEWQRIRDKGTPDEVTAALRQNVCLDPKTQYWNPFCRAKKKTRSQVNTLK